MPARQFTLQLQQDLLISPVHIDGPNRMLLMEPQDGSPLRVIAAAYHSEVVGCGVAQQVRMRYSRPVFPPQDTVPLHKWQPGAIPDDLVQHIPHHRLVLLR